MKFNASITKRDVTVSAVTVLITAVPLFMVARKQATELPSTAVEWTTVKATATKVGDRRQFLDAATHNLDNLECHVSTLNPGELAHPPHQHPEEEMTIVKEGTIEVLVNGEQKRVGPGSVVFQASNVLHSTKNVGTTPAVYYAIRWRTKK